MQVDPSEMFNVDPQVGDVELPFPKEMKAQPGTPVGQLFGHRAGAKELRARTPLHMKRDPMRPPPASPSQKREADEEAHPQLSGHWKRNSEKESKCSRRLLISLMQIS